MARRLTSALMMAATLIASPARADDQGGGTPGEAPTTTIGCHMDGAVLDCTGNGTADASRAEALSSTVTFAVLRKQLENPDFRKTAAKREVFRRSLERNRAAAQRVADRAERAYRRNRIDKDTLDAAQAAHRAALDNYRAGILVYHTGIWKDPEGAELRDD